MDIGRNAKITLSDNGQPVMLDVIEWRNADGTKADFGPWPAFSDSFPDSVTFRLTVDPDEPNGFDDWFSAFWGLPKAPSLSPKDVRRARRRAARRRQRLARRITRRAAKR